jgi:hypothetical protein
MKIQLAMTAVVGLLAACTGQTVTPIQSMSENAITVAYVDGFAGPRDTYKVAQMHCSTPRAQGSAPLQNGSMVDETAVHYSC